MNLHALEALLYYCCLINGGLLLISAGTGFTLRG